jgi:hypothetical protein
MWKMGKVPNDSQATDLRHLWLQNILSYAFCLLRSGIYRYFHEHIVSCSAMLYEIDRFKPRSSVCLPSYTRICLFKEVNTRFMAKILREKHIFSDS